MTLEQLRAVHQARPFRPFTLELADGNRIKVPHPEFVSFHPRGRTIAVAVSEEAFKIVDLFLVASIHVGNGTSTGKRKR